MSDRYEQLAAEYLRRLAAIDMVHWRRRTGHADRLEEILADDRPVNSKPSASKA
jgi:hypothetical protein